ncbi:MAG: DUF3168 domain-containing protein [Pseudomonadota bacterium]
MSYGMAMALQQAVFSALSNDATVAALADGAIYDAIPPGPVPALYVSLGPEKVRDLSDGTGRAAVHDFPVLVVGDGAGFGGMKALAAAVSDVLTDAELTLSRGRLTALNFIRARARRVADRREIEVWFRAYLDDGDR